MIGAPADWFLREVEQHKQTKRALERLMDAAVTWGMPRNCGAYQNAVNALLASEDDCSLCGGRPHEHAPGCSRATGKQR